MPGLCVKILESSSPKLLEANINNLLASENLRGIKTKEHPEIVGIAYAISPEKSGTVYSCVILYERKKD